MVGSVVVGSAFLGPLIGPEVPKCLFQSVLGLLSLNLVVFVVLV